MNIAEIKEEIKLKIDRIEDEALISEIARMLHLDDGSDIPEWHKQIINEREGEYLNGTSNATDWEEVKKTL